MARTGRPRAKLILSEEETIELERLARRSRTNRHLAMRAKRILKSARGLANTVVAKELRTSAILDYVEAHNEEGKSFRWTKSADEVLESVKRFAQR